MLHICLAIVSLIGLVMNGYILVVVLLTKQVSANNILLVHLGLVAVLLSIVHFTFSLPTLARGSDNWLESVQWACTIEGLLLTLLHPMVMWTMCGLNCDRFYAIASPLHYSAIVNPRKVVIGLCIGWLVVFLLAFPPLVTEIAPFIFVPELAACFPGFARRNSIYYTGVYTLITFVVPTIIILGCNIKVLQIAKRHRHRIASAIYEVTLSAQVTITHQRNPFFVPTITAPSAGGPRFRSRSPVSSTTHLVGSFLVLYLPFYAALLYQSTSVYFEHGPEIELGGKYLLIAACALLVISPSVNGLLYGLKSKVLRKSFQNYWRKQMSKNEINHEIQARTPSTCGSRRPSLTPFGLLGRPCLQRQMSELFFDTENNRLSGRETAGIKRTSSELAWPTNMRSEIERNDVDPRSAEKGGGSNLSHTASCSTLVVPKSDNELASTTEQELYLTIKNSFRNHHSTNPRNFTLNISSNHSGQGNGHKYKYTHLLMNTNRSFNGGAKFLNKVLRFDSGHHNQPNVEATRRASIQPQILITSACSVDQMSGDEDQDETQQQMSVQDEPHTECSMSTNSSNVLNRSDQQNLDISYLERVAELSKPSSAGNCYHEKEMICEENGTAGIRTIAQSNSRPKRVQSLDDSYRDLSENEEQLLLLSWPVMRRKFQVGNRRKYQRNGSVADEEEIELNFQRERIVSGQKSHRSRKQRVPPHDLYACTSTSSSSESIPSSTTTPSSMSLFSDRVEAPEVII